MALTFGAVAAEDEAHVAVDGQQVVLACVVGAAGVDPALLVGLLWKTNASTEERMVT